MSFAPTVRSNEEEKSQELIADGSTFTVADAYTFSVTTNFPVIDINKRLQELGKGLEKDPHHSTFSPLPLPKEENGSSTVMLEPWICDISAELLPTEIHSPESIHHAVSTINISGSKLYFAFIFITPDLVRSENFVLKNAVSSPAKMVGNTASAALPQRVSFVFDPGRTPTITMHTVRRNHRKFQNMVTRTIIVATPPPQRSTFFFDLSGYREFQSSTFD